MHLVIDGNIIQLFGFHFFVDSQPHSLTSPSEFRTKRARGKFWELNGVPCDEKFLHEKSDSVILTPPPPTEAPPVTAHRTPSPTTPSSCEEPRFPLRTCLPVFVR